MIDRLLDIARRAVDGADALWRRGETTAVAFESGRLKAAGITEESGINLRLVANGRMGVVGSTSATPDFEALVARARASAELGETVDLAFPPSSQLLPPIPTFFDRTANAALDDLIRMGKRLVERLERPDCQVNVGVEREVAQTLVGNNRGARAEYRATGIAVTADITRIAGDDVLMIYDHYVGADIPTEADLETLVRSIETRLTAALTLVTPPEGALPVVFTPAGLGAVVLPLEQALSGKTVLQGSSPLAGKIGETIFDQRLSIVDDPLVPGRSASRPIDDECVPSRATALVEGGRVRQFVYDLETAARAKTQSTGNGRRGVFGKPRIGYTNIVFQVSDAGRSGPAVPMTDMGGGLVRDIDDGLIVDDLIGVGQGNVISGAFSHPVALAYRVQRGEVTGRVKDAAVAGNVYDLLKKIGGFGSDGRWLGARWSPSLLLEGVSVARAARAEHPVAL
ncbi:MAG TPA: TldD/PmbA family protein [Gemmatimonadales bacterium]|nr:TldD/PmbA family protein [Gemmatimonadales bacterium]